MAMPARIIDVIASPDPDQPDLRTATVDLEGVRRSICLAYTPEADVGDYVLIHVGYAIRTVDEAEAERTLAVVRAIPEALTAGSGTRPVPPADDRPRRAP